MDYYISLAELAKEININRDNLYSHIKRTQNLFYQKKIKIDISKYYSKIETKIDGKNRTSKIIIYDKNRKKFLEAIKIAENIKFRKEQVKKQKPEVISWKDDSIYCYSINSQCRICHLAKIYPSLMKECQLYKAVKILLKKRGVPDGQG